LTEATAGLLLTIVVNALNAADVNPSQRATILGEIEKAAITAG
jgi:hypothetical protein